MPIVPIVLVGPGESGPVVLDEFVMLAGSAGPEVLAAFALMAPWRPGARLSPGLAAVAPSGALADSKWLGRRLRGAGAVAWFSVRPRRCLGW
ncbi:hypothetical protein ACFCYC_14065 [Streptomyces sp. NPDC056402]|uniref:hypothetical protein n=1 Tax=Streptomyces sp. NPDC056402 TaxID=3345810 RepID=UPI0035DE2069